MNNNINRIKTDIDTYSKMLMSVIEFRELHNDAKYSESIIEDIAFLKRKLLVLIEEYNNILSELWI